MGVDEAAAAGGDVRPGRHDPGRHRGIERCQPTSKTGPGEAGGLLRDHPESSRMVVAAGDRGAPGGGAEGRGKHAALPQPIPGHQLHR